MNTIGKEHFTSLYSPARERAFTKKNILAGWSKAGLFPFNPDKVLRDISSPPVECTEDLEVLTSRTLQGPAMQSPKMPVSAETFVSLQDLILEQDASELDPTNKCSLQRHLRKLDDSKCVHLQDQNYAHAGDLNVGWLVHFPGDRERT